MRVSETGQVIYKAEKEACRAVSEFKVVRRGPAIGDVMRQTTHPHVPSSKHRGLALQAAADAEDVLGLFEAERPDDMRPRRVIEAARAWVRGDLSMVEARKAAFAAHSRRTRVDFSHRDCSRQICWSCCRHRTCRDS